MTMDAPQGIYILFTLFCMIIGLNRKFNTKYELIINTIILFTVNLLVVGLLIWGGFFG